MSRRGADGATRRPLAVSCDGTVTGPPRYRRSGWNCSIEPIFSSMLACQAGQIVTARIACSSVSPLRPGLVDQETCVPLRMEFFGNGDGPRRILEADFSKVTKEATGWVPRELTMNDIVDGTRTTLSVESLEVNADIPWKKFTPSNLERRR